MKPRTAALLASGVVLIVAASAAASPPFDYDAYRHAIGIHESGGSYSIVNTYGYLGKYQMGAQALEDLGLLKSGTWKIYHDNAAALSDASAWVAPYTRSGFLADGPLQERLMVRLTSANRRSLERNGVLTARSTPVEQAAWLAVAHGLGPGAANTFFRRGETKPDGYGTTAAQIYRVGAYSQRHPYQLTAANKIAVANGRMV